MICDFCGQTNPNDANFCTSCGNNLKQTVLLNQMPPESEIRYTETQFKVEQKLIALSPTYRISDAGGREFMIAKKKILNPFRPLINITSPEGGEIGTIQGNFLRTEWKFYDHQGQLHAVIKFPLIMFIGKSFEIHTGLGIFRSGTSVFAKRFDAYDMNNNLSFVVDKKLISLRDSFTIQSNGLLSPFITCLAAVCIDMKFHQGD